MAVVFTEWWRSRAADGLQRSAAAQQMGGREALDLDPGPLHRPSHDVSDGGTGQAAVRGHRAQEHRRVPDVWSRADDVVLEGVPGILRQWQ